MYRKKWCVCWVFVIYVALFALVFFSTLGMSELLS